MISEHRPERTYVGTSIPDISSPVYGIEIDKARKIICEIYNVIDTPSIEIPEASILWPKDQYVYRVIGSTLELLDEEDGFSDEKILDEWFSSVSQEDFYYWSSFGQEEIDVIFRAPYSRENRIWMMNARFKENQGITNIDGSTSIVSDLFFGFNVISSSAYNIEILDEMYGGVEKLYENFVTYVRARVQREEKRKWIDKYILSSARIAPKSG